MDSRRTNGQITVDMAHGTLIDAWPRLRDWLAEDEAALLEREEIREAARDWEASGRDDGFLAHRDDRLAQARALATHPRMALTALEQDYLAASVTAELAAQHERADLAETARQESERRVAQQRVFLFIATTLVIVAVGAAAFAMVYQMRAARQRDVSLARALAAQSLVEHDRGDDQRAALLARQAWLTAPESAARAQIGTALQATAGAPFFSTNLRDRDAPVQALTALALDSTGRYLADVRMGQSAIRIWDLDNPGDDPLRLTCHGRAVTTVAFGTGAAGVRSQYLASGSERGGIFLWSLDNLDAAFAGDLDVAADPCARGLGRTKLEFGSALRAVAFARLDTDLWLIAGGCGDETPCDCPSGNLPCPTGNGRLRAWNVADSNQKVTLEVPGGEVWSLAVSTAGDLAAGTCPSLTAPNNYCDQNESGTIAFWEDGIWALPRSLAPTWTFATAEGGGVAALAFRPTDRRLASGWGDRAIRLWDPDGSPAGKLTGHDAEIRALAFSPDGSLLASGSQDETVRVWDMSRSGQAIASAVLPGRQWVRALAFAQGMDGRMVLAATGAEGTARVWHISQPGHALTPPMVLRGHDNYVRGLAFSPDGQFLASSGEDGTVRLWGDPTAPNAETLSQIGDLGDADADADKITSVAFARTDDRRRLVAAGDASGAVWVRDLSAPDPEFKVIGQHPKRTGSDDDTGVTAVAFFPPSGDLIASASMDGTVRLWDPVGEARGEPLALGNVNVRALAFDHDGTTLAAAGCRLGRSGTCEFDTGFIAFWQIDPTGGSFATSAILSRCEKGAKTQASLHVGATRHEPFLCDGSQDERTMFGGVASIAFGPADLPLLATGHASGAVVTWDVDRLAGVSEDEAPRLLGQHEGEIRSLAFSPKGDPTLGVFLASGSTDQTARLWDPAMTAPGAEIDDLAARLLRFIRGDESEGHALAIIDARGEFVRALAFSPQPFTLEDVPDLESAPAQSPVLASVAADGTLRLSIAASETLANRVCTLAWRNLSLEEWDRFVGPGVPYQRTCPDLPPGEGAPPDPAFAAPTLAPADPN